MTGQIIDVIEQAGAKLDAGEITEADAVAWVVQGSQGWITTAGAPFLLGRWQQLRRELAHGAEVVREELERARRAES